MTVTSESAAISQFSLLYSWAIRQPQTQIFWIFYNSGEAVVPAVSEGARIQVL